MFDIKLPGLVTDTPLAPGDERISVVMSALNSVGNAATKPVPTPTASTETTPPCKFCPLTTSVNGPPRNGTTAWLKPGGVAARSLIVGCSVSCGVTVKQQKSGDVPPGVVTVIVRGPGGALGSIVIITGRFVAVPRLSMRAVTPLPKSAAITPSRLVPVIVALRIVLWAPELGIIPVIVGTQLLMLSVIFPVILAKKLRTRMWKTVPATMFSVEGPGNVLGTRLVRKLPLESSSAANSGSLSKLGPVKTPSTVSKLLPMVSMNDVGCVTVNEQGAVHVHQALGVPLPLLMPSEGSPGSTVKPTLDPVVVTALPVRVNPGKLSLVAGGSGTLSPSRKAVMSSIMSGGIEIPPMALPSGELLKATDV